MKKRITFLINPISGGKSKSNFPETAEKYLDHSRFEIQYLFTKHQGHAYDLAKSSDSEILVAVGGDGTINEVASALVDTEKTMGIVPFGSGNGLARSLGIPLRSMNAVKRLNQLNVSRIDTGLFNERQFFNMAGMGFDAHISALFANGVKRGFGGYVKATVREISTYRAEHYRIEVDGNVYERNAFMINIANSSQFGNNAHISPKASVKDGLLDVCITRPFPLYQIPILGVRLFSQTSHRSAYLEIIRGKEICISRNADGAVHVDGEPLQMGKELHIKIKPLSLSIII